MHAKFNRAGICNECHVSRGICRLFASHLIKYAIVKHLVIRLKGIRHARLSNNLEFDF